MHVVCGIKGVVIITIHVGYYEFYRLRLLLCIYHSTLSC